MICPGLVMFLFTCFSVASCFPFVLSFFFFFNDTATTEIYTLSLHDALPISHNYDWICHFQDGVSVDTTTDRKSTRLNSSHANISYAVFCLKKKKKNEKMLQQKKKKKKKPPQHQHPKHT